MKALTERRSREMYEQSACRVRGAQQLEERIRREAEKEVAVLRGGSVRLEAEAERLRLEGERSAAAARQEVHRLRYDAFSAVVMYFEERHLCFGSC